MLTRREFFRGTSLGAGAVYLAPFLAQLEGAATGAAQPARFVFFLQGNGLYPNEIQPEGIERPRDPKTLEDRPLTGHALSSSLSPLQPFAHRVTLLHGLSGRVARDSHGSGPAALGMFPSIKTTFAETVDAAVCKKLGGIFPHVGLGVQNKPHSVIYNTSVWDKGKALPTQCNPILAYRMLFGVAATGEQRKRFDAKTSVLDFMADDVKRLQARLNSDEKEKLDHYLDAFESMGARQSQLAEMAGGIRKAAPKIDPKVGDIVYDKNGGKTGVFERLEAQFDIAAGALIAGLTNVVTVSSGVTKGGTGVSVDGSEIGLADGPIGSHAIGHGKSYFGKDAGEIHASIRRSHMEKLAGFIRRLESIPEGAGTMMDHTLIVYASDSAESHHPVSKEWPFVLIGNLGGRLKTGNRYIRYPWYGHTGHRTVANLYTTFLHAVGDRRERFGLPDIALKDIDQDGPLKELLA